MVIGGLSAGTAAVLGDLALGLRGHSHPPPAPATTGPPDAYARSAAADEQDLIGAYEEATRRHPALAATLALPLAHHREHLAALTRSTARGTSVPPTTTSSGPPPGIAEVAGRRAALAALQARESTAAGRRRAAAVRDVRGDGTLLARIGAAEAVHADYLAAAVTDLQPPAPSTSSTPPLPTGRPSASSPAPRSRATTPPPHTTSTAPRAAAPPTTSTPPATTPTTPGTAGPSVAPTTSR